LVIEDEMPPVLEAEAHRCVRRAFTASRGGGVCEQAACHAEVHGHHSSVVEAQEDVLGAALHGHDLASEHTPGETASWLPKHVGVGHLDPGDATAHDCGPQAANDGFGFR
jgi:hypothetical protein